MFRRITNPIFSRVVNRHHKFNLFFPLSNASQNYGNKQYSAAPPPQRSASFIGKIIENYKEESARNKKLQQSVKDFRKDMDNIEKSDAIKTAREKYRIVGEETAEGTQKAKQQLEALKKKMQDVELLQKAGKATEEASKQAQKMGHKISQKGEEIAQTQTYKTISSTAKLVKEEIDHTTFGKGSRVYIPPTVLKMRIERDLDAEEKIIEANADATGVILHKDSVLSQQWEDFKNKNPYVNKLIDLKTKLDESNNPVVRASLLFKDKASELFGNVFQQSTLSETVTEICKVDPNFELERFLLECEYFIIPNILEAMVRPDVGILKDWCTEHGFSILSVELKKAQVLGLRNDSKVLDVDLVELMTGHIVDKIPVLILSFQSQQILCYRNSENEVVEGNPDKVLRVHHVWLLSRDQSEMNAQAAWRLMESQAHVTKQFL